MSPLLRTAPAAEPLVGEPQSKTTQPRPASQQGLAPADLLLHTSHATISVRQSPGRKLPTLFLHGNSAGKAVFEQQLSSAVGQEYRLIAVDLPGHGASSDAFDPDRSYTITSYAEAVIEVVEQLGLDQIAVVGWSLGGHVGMELMALYPDLVGLMIVGAPPVAVDPAVIHHGFCRNPDLLLAGQEVLSEPEVEAFARLIAGGSLDPDLRDMIRRTDGRARRIMFANLFSGQTSDHRQLVESLDTIPLAVVNGADDPIINPDYIASLPYAHLWRNTCHLLPRTGHTPFREAPQVFNDLLARFLADVNHAARARAENPPLSYSA